MGTAVKPTYIFLSGKSWNDSTIKDLQQDQDVNWIRIRSKEEFVLSRLLEIRPSKIFIPHWSYIIPAEIFGKFECIVFHMTDLPYGRGGSPLQNLIVRGHTKTKISALRVVQDLDAGPIYLKKDLDLHGTANEIFLRASVVIGQMIKDIIRTDIKPAPQLGNVVTFKRRTPSESDLKNNTSVREAFDHIRMLDAEGYPHAFLETGDLRFEFTDAVLSEDGELKAHVRIFKK